MTERRRRSRKRDGLDGPIRKDGELYFGPGDLLKLLLAEERVQCCAARASQIDSHIAQLRAENEVRVRDKLKEREKVVVELNKRLGEIGTLRRALEARYGFEFEGVTFDDETGLITLPDKE